MAQAQTEAEEQHLFYWHHWAKPMKTNQRKSLARMNGQRREEGDAGRRKKKSVKEGMTGRERERERGGIQRSGPACGNSDAVFMDVYLSASPPGSSHFPLGDGWSPGETFLLHLKVLWPSDRRTHTHESMCRWSLGCHRLLFTCDVTQPKPAIPSQRVSCISLPTLN